MPRFHDKWLALFLALLLGVAPFVRAYADVQPNSSPHASAGMFHDEAHQQMMAESDCDNCSASHSCSSGDCSCYHCGTCSVTLLHVALHLPHACPSSFTPTELTGMLTHHPFLLFRPPRA